MPPTLPPPFSNAVAASRSRLGRALRNRVAGDDASARAQVIWGRPGPRWFTVEDPIWRVHADAAMFVGGIRALLLQSLHPLAMAGVAGHSGYRGDPWGRLRRTSDFIATTTFGTIEDAEAAIARVRAVHATVTGTAPDGRRYAASDPHLLRWVHVAEADSFLTAHQAYGEDKLTAPEQDRYVEQAALVAERLGVLNPPLTRAALSLAVRQYRPELTGTEEARDTARFLLLTPPVPIVQRPGYAALAAGAVSCLPRWARHELGLPVSEQLDRGVGMPLGRVAAAAVRWALDDPAIAADRRSAPVADSAGPPVPPA